jgi:hypothetical protein
MQRITSVFDNFKIRVILENHHSLLSTIGGTPLIETHAKNPTVKQTHAWSRSKQNVECSK